MNEKELIELKINSIYKILNKDFEIEPVNSHQMKVFRDATRTSVIITVRSYVDISIELHRENDISNEGEFSRQEDVILKVHELLEV